MSVLRGTRDGRYGGTRKPPHVVAGLSQATSHPEVLATRAHFATNVLVGYTETATRHSEGSWPVTPFRTTSRTDSSLVPVQQAGGRRHTRCRPHGEDARTLCPSGATACVILRMKRSHTLRSCHARCLTSHSCSRRRLGGSLCSHCRISTSTGCEPHDPFLSYVPRSRQCRWIYSPGSCCQQPGGANREPHCQY